MPVTALIIRALPDRWRGFLQSVALEVGTGIFLAPNMKQSVRARVWDVANDWFPHQNGGSFVMVWVEGRDVKVLALGEPPRSIAYLDGLPVAISGCGPELARNPIFDHLQFHQ